LIIENLKEVEIDVKVALKEKSILNDACIEDVVQIGLDEVTELV